MQIVLNGSPLKLERNTNIAALLTQQGYNGKLVAVAVNGSFVPKSSYAAHTFNDNDKIEIVAPMQGG